MSNINYMSAHLDLKFGQLEKMTHENSELGDFEDERRKLVTQLHVLSAAHFHFGICKTILRICSCCSRVSLVNSCIHDAETVKKYSVVQFKQRKQRRKKTTIFDLYPCLMPCHCRCPKVAIYVIKSSAQLFFKYFFQFSVKLPDGSK